MFGTIAALCVCCALIIVGVFLANNDKGAATPQHWSGVALWVVGWVALIYCANERYSAHSAQPQSTGSVVGFMGIALVLSVWLGYLLAVTPGGSSAREHLPSDAARVAIVAARRSRREKDDKYVGRSVFEQFARQSQEGPEQWNEDKL